MPCVPSYETSTILTIDMHITFGRTVADCTTILSYKSATIIIRRVIVSTRYATCGVAVFYQTSVRANQATYMVFCTMCDTSSRTITHNAISIHIANQSTCSARCVCIYIGRAIKNLSTNQACNQTACRATIFRVYIHYYSCSVAVFYHRVSFYLQCEGCNTGSTIQDCILQTYILDSSILNEAK